MGVEHVADEAAVDEVALERELARDPRVGRIGNVHDVEPRRDVVGDAVALDGVLVRLGHQHVRAVADEIEVAWIALRGRGREHGARI